MRLLLDLRENLVNIAIVTVLTLFNFLLQLLANNYLFK